MGRLPNETQERSYRRCFFAVKNRMEENRIRFESMDLMDHFKHYDEVVNKPTSTRFWCQMSPKGAEHMWSPVSNVSFNSAINLVKLMCAQQSTWVETASSIADFVLCGDVEECELMYQIFSEVFIRCVLIKTNGEGVGCPYQCKTTKNDRVTFATFRSK